MEGVKVTLRRRTILGVFFLLLIFATFFSFSSFLRLSYKNIPFQSGGKVIIASATKPASHLQVPSPLPERLFRRLPPDLASLLLRAIKQPYLREQQLDRTGPPNTHLQTLGIREELKSILNSK